MSPGDGHSASSLCPCGGGAARCLVAEQGHWDSAPEGRSRCSPTPRRGRAGQTGCGDTQASAGGLLLPACVQCVRAVSMHTRGHGRHSLGPGRPQNPLGKSQGPAPPQTDSLGAWGWDPGFGACQPMLRPSERLLTSSPPTPSLRPSCPHLGWRSASSEAGLCSHPTHLLQPEILLSRARPRPSLTPGSPRLLRLRHRQQHRPQDEASDRAPTLPCCLRSSKPGRVHLAPRPEPVHLICLSRPLRQAQPRSPHRSTAGRHQRVTSPSHRSRPGPLPREAA